MNNTIKNTTFDNLVNYSINQSSASAPQVSNYNSSDPTSLGNLSKDSLLVKYNLLEIVEKQITE